MQDPRFTNPFYIPRSYEEAVEIAVAEAQRLVPLSHPSNPQPPEDDFYLDDPNQ